MMDNNEFNQAFSSLLPEVADTFDTTVLFDFILGFFIQLSFSYLWGLINTL